MKFSIGFTFNDVRYGWNNGKLYRLPFEREGRNYGLIEVKPCFSENKKTKQKTKCYNIQRNKMTENRVTGMTKKVKWNISILKHKDLPFTEINTKVEFCKCKDRHNDKLICGYPLPCPHH